MVGKVSIDTVTAPDAFFADDTELSIYPVLVANAFTVTPAKTEKEVE